MTLDETALSKPLRMSRRRFGWGVTAVIVSGLLGVAVHVCATWAPEVGPNWLVLFVLPGWTLFFGAHLISGAAAVTGLALLLPPLLRRIRRTWLRRLVAVLVVMAAIAGSLPWLVSFVGLGLNMIQGTYSKVSAEGGESVIIEHSGFDRRAYSVFRQKSSFLWEKSVGWQTAPDVFDADNCTLAAREADLLLTCGTDRVPVPSLN